MGRTSRVRGSLGLGDVAAAARVLRQAGAASMDGVAEQRRTLAEFCRFALCGAEPPHAAAAGDSQAGAHHGAVVATSAEAAAGSAPGRPLSSASTTTSASPPPITAAVSAVTLDSHLPPRVRQTLEHLLRGDGEKQIAVKLGLSRHTVHVYIKTLHKHYNVCSRSELLARFIPHLTLMACVAGA